MIICMLGIVVSVLWSGVVEERQAISRENNANIHPFPKPLRLAQKNLTKSGLPTMGLPIPLCLLFLDRLYYVHYGKNTSLRA